MYRRVQNTTTHKGTTLQHTRVQHYNTQGYYNTQDHNIQLTKACTYAIGSGAGGHFLAKVL